MACLSYGSKKNVPSEEACFIFFVYKFKCVFCFIVFELSRETKPEVETMESKSTYGKMFRLNLE